MAVSSGSRSGPVAPLLLWLALAVPSSSSLSWGRVGVLLYLACSLVVFLVGMHRTAEGLERRVENSAALRNAIAVSIVLAIILAAAGYALVNTSVPGHGTDSDEALVQGVQAVLSGRNPYDERTYLGNLVVNMPGALGFAFPFVVTNTIAIQNVAWLVIGFAVATCAWGRRRALAVWCVVLLASPGLWRLLVNANDVVANGLFVTILSVGLIRRVRTGRADRATLALAVVVGVALSSRLNFVVLFVPVACFVARRVGAPAARRVLLCVLLGFLAVTLPLLLIAPSTFGPLRTTDKLRLFDGTIQHASVGLALATVAVAVVCSLRWSARSDAWFALACGLMLVTPVAGGMAIGIATDALPPAFAFYGYGATWFLLHAVFSR